MRLERTADFSKNMNRCKETQEPCARCGRPIKDLDRAKWIRLTVSDEIIPADASVDPSQDMGAFPIGPECRKAVGV